MLERRGLVALALSIVVLTGACATASRGAPPRAQKGVLNLTGWDLNRQGAVTLDGDWEFYWNQLLTPGDFAGSAHDGPRRTGYLRMPGGWKGFGTDDDRLPGTGFATLRLTVKTKHPTLLYGLYLSDFNTAAKLWANGQELATVGTVGTTVATTVPKWLPKVIYARTDDSTIELVLQLANFHDRYAAMRTSSIIGVPEQISRERDNRIAQDLLVCGALLIMSLYHVVLYLLRREDASPLLFAIFTASVGFRALLTNTRLLATLWPDATFSLACKLEYVSMHVAFVAFMMFLRSVFPEEFSRFVLRFSQISGFAFALFTVVTPPQVFTQVLVPFQLIMVVLMPYCIFVIAKALIRRKEGAVVAGSGIVFLFITVLLDILGTHFLQPLPFVAAFGVFILTLSQASLLSIRFSRAFSTVETLSEVLKTKNKALQRLDRLKDEFLANTSHELRTPLNGIIGIAESLLDGVCGRLSGSVRQHLGMIAMSGRRLSALVNDVLDLSRLKHRDIVLQLGAVELRGLVGVVLETSQSLMGAKKLELRNDVPDDLPYLLADENRLQQVLYNLVGNAIKFTEEGRVEVSAQVGGDLVTVSVADTGIGIAEESQQDIFREFEQLDGSASRKYGGTGLGLSITKKLVEIHGGHISVRSRPAEGSILSFTIPIATEERKRSLQPLLRQEPGTPVYDESAGNGGSREPWLEPDGELEPTEVPEGTAERGEETREAEAGAKYRILAVDDDPVNLRVIMNQLALRKYEVVPAASGAEALKIMEEPSQRSTFDLILLDVMMPHLSGYEVARRLRERYAPFELPIMMLTGKTQIVDIATGLEAGANDYLPKPIEKKELLARVQTLLTLRRAVQEKLDLIRRLEGLNAALEKSVADRTAELTQKNTLLQQESRRAEEANRELQRLNEDLAVVARTDPLTGLPNRRELLDRMASEVARAQRTGRTFAVVMCDLDLFKRINDRYGHDAGDHVLVSTARLLQRELRGQDVLSRWGGEEFLLLLPETDLPGATVVAEKLRVSLESEPIDFEGHRVGVTASMGVSVFRAPATAEECVRIADECLYQAKFLGRNRVVASRQSDGKLPVG